MGRDINRIRHRADRVPPVWRILIVAGLLGCVNQAARLANPSSGEGEGGGTLTCREILETCDSACTQPLCLHGCTGQGTAEAQPQHDALLSCGERNGCTDEDCMRANCMTEFEACQGPPAAEPPATAEPAAPAEPAATAEPAN
jgi:hypothetical protein